MNDLSPFVREAFPYQGLSASLSILDLGCGFGRHAVLFALRGHWVTALDHDEQRLSSLLRRSAFAGHGSLSAVLADAQQPLPFRAGAFDAVVVVHLPIRWDVASAHATLKPGGLLVVETIGAQGDNWRQLPKPGELREQLTSGFEVLTYRERPVGPGGVSATVKLIARKR